MPVTRTQPGRTRVVVVDDHPAIREALAAIIGSKIDLELCGAYGSAEEAMRMMEEMRPDVVVVEMLLEDEHGIELVKKIREQYAEINVLVFSMFDEQIYAERALLAGASGYIMKSDSTQEVINAIRSTARGEIYLSQRMASRLLRPVRSRKHASSRFAIDQLNPRELTVFNLLGHGLEMDEIAERLQLEQKTVEKHRRRMKEKLGFETVGELVRYAIQWTLSHGSRR